MLETGPDERHSFIDVDDIKQLLINQYKYLFLKKKKKSGLFYFAIFFLLHSTFIL